MHLIIALLVFVGLAAIIIWIADWTSGGEGRATAFDVLNRRLARGEISRAEYDRKRTLAVSHQRLRHSLIPLHCLRLNQYQRQLPRLSPHVPPLIRAQHLPERRVRCQ